MRQPKQLAIVICPHCAEETLMLPACQKCGDTLRFDDFRRRMADICALERLYNLVDQRKETR